MLIKRPDDIPPSEITPRELFERRRAGRYFWLGLAPEGTRKYIPGLRSVLRSEEVRQPMAGTLLTHCSIH